MEMEFKIDTKDTFTIIMPLKAIIDAKLTGAIQEKCNEVRQSGSTNIIVDCSNCTEMDKNAIPGLVEMHENSYANDQSLVYTGINKQGMAILKEEETDLLINVTPSMKEAIDIISMEILERDLYSEE
jgi:anti-anti-sigma regulatory factor